VQWPTTFVGPRIGCEVTAGTCTIGTIDTVLRQAVIEWDLPSTTGAHSLNVVVGKWNYFVSARDDLLVQ
jgi:hypothetical protein